MARWACLFLALLALLPEPAEAQVLVAPRRPGKSVVRYWKHDWRHVDVAGGGIRLWYDAREAPAAAQAAAVLEEAWDDHVATFGFTPPQRAPYILYGSYQAFQRTNLFPIQEGVLGVTSTQTLATTLPWFGDARQFEHVARHELAHAFLLQRVRAGSSRADPSQALPLWFHEGVAEFAARGALEPEQRMVLADLAANPDLEAGYGLVDFWYDIPQSVLWTYNVGHARVAFLEEVYGAGTSVRVLEEMADLPTTRFTTGVPFVRAVEEVTGAAEDAIARRFRDWVKVGAYGAWLEARQHAGDLAPVDAVRGRPQALDASPDGRFLLYRSVDPHTGRVRLVLADAKAPRSTRIVTSDARPGTETLHPVDPRSFDLGADALVYVAEARGRDVLYWRAVNARTKERRTRPGEPDGDAHVTRFRLGEERAFPVDAWGLVAAYSPTLSPDGRSVAFVGLAPGGARDLWALSLEDGEATRLTDDAYAEASPSWGPDGVVYASDATGHRKLNLFRVRVGEAPERLTSEPRDHFDPVALPDGRTVFVAWTDGHADLWERVAEGVRPLTAVDTALTDPSPGPDGEIWAMHRASGTDVPVRVVGSPGPTLPPEPDHPPAAPEVVALDGAAAYRPDKAGNWHVEDLFGLVGAGGGYVFGQVFLTASDTLRDHLVVVDAATYGDPRLTDGTLLYVNQSGRSTWGAGAFHLLRFHASANGEVFQVGERFYGGLASWRWPFDQFVHVQLDEAIGGSRRFSLTGAYLGSWGFFGDWQEAEGDAALQSETTARVGVDTITYHPTTGPLTGGSAMLAATLGARPTPAAYGMLRLDAERYVPVPLGDGANLGFRGAAGTAFGGDLAPSFWLLSHETLRAVPYYDVDFLLGRHYWFGRAELQVPLDSLVRVVFLTGVEAIAGLDLGATADDPLQLWDRRVLDVALGGNMALGPLVVRVHVARAIDTGAPLPPQDPPWRTNVSLGWVTW
ncbi:MAG: LpqB family beta-propeller domain-containing protein [Myxococcota bacterium]